MSNQNPVDLETAIAAARNSTALVTDSPKPALNYNPVIGEQSLYVVKPALDAIEPTMVLVPNVDANYAAIIASELADKVESERYKPAFEKLPPEVMGEARPGFLRDLAFALFFLENRARSSSATKQDVRVDPTLFSDGLATRERMLRVLTYHFVRDVPMQADLADIRSGTGYMDLASDLVRLATHYSAHRAVLAADTRQYDAKDEHFARGVANELFMAQRGAADPGVSDLRNRCWTKTQRVYGKLRAAAELLFFDNPSELTAFPSMRQAVLAISGRSRSPVVEEADPNAPPSPVAPGPSPVSPAAPVAPPIGAGPGGNPLI